MEGNYRARRRMYHLACQLAPSARFEDQPWPHSPRSLSAMACSASVSGTISRRDNRTLFARQSSDTFGQFMRQMHPKQVVLTEDERFTRLPAPESGSNCKDCSVSDGKKSGETSENEPGPSFAAVAPLFGKPVLNAQPFGKQMTDTPGQNQGPQVAALSQEDGPKSQTRSSTQGRESSHTTPVDADNRTCAGGFGFEWFPRMDVVESGTAYVITIELPGVSADGIHVEVVRNSLIVTGSRATDWWKANSAGNNGGGTVYHRRELAQGPYRAVWRLPKNVDINGVTAEFIDGFLRVLIPKIKIMTYL